MPPAAPTASAAGRTDRLPPYSEEAERGVLGSALLDPERVIDLCVENGLGAESFYMPTHRALFELLVAMREQNRAIDLLTVSQRLKDVGQLEQVGGAANIEQMVDQTPTSAHAEYYIDIVRQKFLLRCIIERSRTAIESCYYGEDTADSILDHAEQAMFDISDFQRRSMTPWPTIIKGVMKQVDRIMTERRDITGIATGFDDLDKLTHGLQPGDMIIIAARPSMGKTSLAVNIAENVAIGDVSDHTKRPVAIFSLEMSNDQLARRMLCSRANVSASKLTGSYLTSANFGALAQSADQLSKASIFIDDTPGLSAVELRARARRMKKRFSIELIVVDYLQMMNYPQFAREGRQRETAAISGSLKAMAKELRVPVIVLSQLSRAPETRDKTAVPKLSDLRDSGSIEQDADVVALLRRPCKYPDDPEAHDQTLAILDIAKHRNGECREIRLNFIGELTKFESRREGVDGANYAPSSGGVG
jgi:replicative DNA helicase